MPLADYHPRPRQSEPIELAGTASISPRSHVAATARAPAPPPPPARLAAAAAAPGRGGRPPHRAAVLLLLPSTAVHSSRWRRRRLRRLPAAAAGGDDDDDDRAAAGEEQQQRAGWARPVRVPVRLRGAPTSSAAPTAAACRLRRRSRRAGSCIALAAALDLLRELASLVIVILLCVSVLLICADGVI